MKFRWSDYKVPEIPTGVYGDIEVKRVTLTKEALGQLGGVTLMEYLQGREIHPGTYTMFRQRVWDEDEGWTWLVWMSDTKAEITDAQEYWCALHDFQAESVLITGHGIGTTIKMALQCPSVKRLDIIELDARVVAASGRVWWDMARENGVSFNVHMGDALKLDLPGEWDVAWHDIWPKIGPRNLPEMDMLEQRYDDRVFCWQGSWARDLCEWMQEVEEMASVYGKLVE